MRVHEPPPVQIGQHRALHPDQQVELDDDDEGDDDADDDCRERPDDSPAQLLEVIEEGHLGRASHRDSVSYLASVRSCSRASEASSDRGKSRTTCSSAARAAAFWPADFNTSARLYRAVAAFGDLG